MSASVKLLKAINKLFPPVVHPFNLQNDGTQTYAQWQYQWGERTIESFAPQYTAEDMFLDKAVLDMGCGASGKSLYYVSKGARSVTGVDVVEHYKKEAEEFAAALGYEDRFRFIAGDATALELPDESFDTVIMNDFMEHVSDPEGALRESLRLLKPGGRVFVNFPPYFHPTGAHLSDAIGIPWVHMLFSEKTLIAAYKDLVRGLPDEQERLALRFGPDENGRESLNYINKMTIRRFRRILSTLDIQPLYYKEIPLRRYFTPLAKMPLVKEMFVKMCACVIEKPAAEKE